MSRLRSPVFLINLARNPQRLAEAKAQFDNVKIEFERIEAVDGEALDAADLERWTRKARGHEFKRPLSAGEVGCYVSHILTWRRIAQSGEPMAFIFEDDISLSPEAPSAMAAIEDGPEDWDIFRLYAHRPPSMTNIRPLCETIEAGVPMKVPFSTIGYAITAPFAAHLTAKASPFFLPVDTDLKRWWVHGHCTRQANPSVVWPRSDGEVASLLYAGRSRVRRRHPLLHLIDNLRFQYHWRHERERHTASLPLTRQFSQSAGPSQEVGDSETSPSNSPQVSR